MVRMRTLEQPARPTDTNLTVYPFKHSVAPTSHSTFSNKSFVLLRAVLRRPNSPTALQCPPNGSQSPKCTGPWQTVTHAYPLFWARVTPNLNMLWVDVLQQCTKPLLPDVHLRVGRRDIGDHQVTMMVYTAVAILKEISHWSLRSTRAHLNIPLWDLWAALNIPENPFSFEAPIRSLSSSADRALHAPDRLLYGLTKFQNRRKATSPRPPRRLASNANSRTFALFKCTAVWDKYDVFPIAPISVDRLGEFVVHTEFPRRFLMPAFPIQREEDFQSARWWHQDVVLGQPGSRLPPLYAARARGWLQHIPYPMGRLCFELDRNRSLPAQGGVRVIELESLFYHLHTLCDKLNAGGMWNVIVDDDPMHNVVAKGYWYLPLSRLPFVEERWLYASMAEVLCSACALPTAAECILQRLMRVYVIEGKLY